MNAGTRSRGFWRAVARHFSSEKRVMAINDPADRQDLLRALSGNDWSVTLEAVNAAERALRDTIVGDAHSDLVVEKMATLANHPKWEVRRAVANAAAHLPHPAFEAPLAKLALDD